jgi:hypothetical protein
MLSLQDVIHLSLTKEEIIDCISICRSKVDISKLDNLRNRNINVQFDCLLRGYIGEYLIKTWLGSKGIIIEESNIIEEDGNIDIDFRYNGVNIELKTSLIPDQDGTIDNMFYKRDIKIIKRTQTLEELQGDLHLQMCYGQRRLAKDSFLQTVSLDYDQATDEMIYDALLCRAYLSKNYFIAWIDKASLIKTIGGLPLHKQVWSFTESKRQFWNCKIKQSRKPAELINFLKGEITTE